MSEVVWPHHAEIRRAYYQKIPQTIFTASIEEESMKIEENMVRADIKAIAGFQNWGDTRIDTGLIL